MSGIKTMTGLEFVLSLICFAMLLFMLVGILWLCDQFLEFAEIS